MSATGIVKQVIGPVLDVEFPPGHLPNILNALTLVAPVLCTNFAALYKSARSIS